MGVVVCGQQASRVFRWLPPCGSLHPVCLQLKSCSPLWQKAPVQPGAHAHEKPSTSSTHVPSFRHEMPTQSSMSTGKHRGYSTGVRAGDRTGVVGGGGGGSFLLEKLDLNKEQPCTGKPSRPFRKAAIPGPWMPPTSFHLNCWFGDRFLQSNVGKFMEMFGEMRNELELQTQTKGDVCNRRSVSRRGVLCTASWSWGLDSDISGPVQHICSDHFRLGNS